MLHCTQPWMLHCTQPWMLHCTQPNDSKGITDLMFGAQQPLEN
jgi:hypothetical protein